MQMRHAVAATSIFVTLCGGLAVPPGVTTEAAGAKLKTLGEKFELQLESCEEKFIEKSKEYETKICEGLGCEPDAKKRALAQIDWDGIVLAYKKEKAHLMKMLAMCWKAKDSVPLRRMFAEWIAEKKLEAHASTVWNVERELRCESYTMGFEDVGTGLCNSFTGLAIPKPAEQPAGCIPMPTKVVTEKSTKEENPEEAQYKFHCSRQCECMALCDLGSGCTHAAWNAEEMSDISSPNCIVYGGSCTPSGEAPWKVYAPE